MDPSILEDFDRPLEDWSLAQMTSFLEKINLESLVDLFEEHAIIGSKFASINKEGLLFLGISSIKAKKLINWQKFIKENLEVTNVEEVKEEIEPDANLLVIELVNKNDADVVLPQFKEIKEEGLEIKRNGSNDPKVFAINDNSISVMKHCEIIFTGDFFLLQDNGSMNGTFVIIPPEKTLVLEEGMNIEMGNTDFFIKKVVEKQLDLEIKLENSKTSSAVICKFENIKEVYTIGSDKNAKNNTNYIYAKDEYMETAHVKLKCDGEKIFLVSCMNKFGVWLNLKDEKTKRFAVLQKNTIFRIAGDFHFKVAKFSQKKQETIENCLKCDKKCDTIMMPCQHICLCQSCATKVKKCPYDQCGVKNPKVEKILIYP